MNFIIENFKSFKVILIVLGLTAVIVFSVMLVGYESYLRTLIGGLGTSVCADSDRTSQYPNGKNYYQKGTITLSDGTKLTDYCMTGGYKDNVMEYYCATNGHGMTNFKCPNGCANGACVKGTTPPPPTCTENDGGINVMKKGTTKDNSNSYTDYCIGNSIVEYFCQNGVAKRASDSPSGYSCSRYGQNMICQNGACVKGTTPPPPTCTEDDGGISYFKRGTCTDSSGSKTDSCSADGKKVFEYHCVNNQRCESQPWYTCPSGYECKNGACVKGTTPPPPTCTDSDGGKDYYQKGHCTDSRGASKDDFCYNGKLHEYSCYNNECGSSYTPYTCPSGYECKNGACVKTAEPEPKCEADGKCKTSGCPTGDPDCSCLEQNGYICNGYVGETCPGVSLLNNYEGLLERNFCCSVACAPAAVYSISGQVTSSEDISSSRIAINLTGTSSASTVTDSSGSYSFNNLINGSYVIAPSDGTWIISPTSQNATISGSNVSGINFTAIKKECNLGETKKHTCPDGTEVSWCSCDNYKWACIDSPENNCPATCEEDGKCKTSGCPTGDPDCSCSEYEPAGFICQANETCPETSLTHSGSGICCSVTCEGNVVHQTADFNCDGNVNEGDMAILLKWWFKNPSGFTFCQSPDINNDGRVDEGDFAIMMSQWTKMTL